MTDLLRDQIRHSTEDIHRYVEGAPIMKDIMNLNPDDNFMVKAVFIDNYIHYLVDIRDIYKILEKSLCHVSECGADKWITGHSRKVQSDIDTLKRLYEDCTGRMIQEPRCTIACSSYLQYLQSITGSQIMAHVYVRVMADLSGGQIIQSKLLKYGCPVQTYQFDYGLKGNIIAWINLYGTGHAASLMGNAHIAFLAYAAILRVH